VTKQQVGFMTDIKTINATKESHPGNRMAKHFDEAYFQGLDDELKPAFVACLRSGIDNADSGMGCYAMQPKDYDRFSPFFAKVIADYHNVPEDATHTNDWSLDGVEGLPEGGKLDLSTFGLPELSMRVRVGRNLSDFPLPGAMSQEDRVALEAKMYEAFKVLIANADYGGQYYSLTPGHECHIDEAKYDELVAAHIMFKDMSKDPYLAACGIAGDWPYGRGVYVSEDKGFITWVGEEDHLRIMCMNKGTILNDVFDRLKIAHDVIDKMDGLTFAQSEKFGYVTSCPTNLGTGMRASVHIQLPKLCADGTDTKAKAVCKELRLSVRGTGGEHTPIVDGVIDISAQERYHIKESEIIVKLYKGLEQLVDAEKKCE